MEHNDASTTWRTYRNQELAVVTPLLEKLGYALDQKQPHVTGERHLMQAITTAHGRKLILLGRRQRDSTRVVIKITSDPTGVRELLHERTCRRILSEIRFAYGVFFSPEELLFTKRGNYTIAVHSFIAQECAFLDRPIAEQFALALAGFKSQEGARATTYAHTKLAQRTFGSRNAEDYLRNFATFKKNILAQLSTDQVLPALLTQTESLLVTHKETIERYGGFLTHTDFVPHNFRIKDANIYLLDHSSLVFGNKYEGWARFLNFMLLHNPALEAVFVQYIKDNRTPEESLCLQLMRTYRLGEIIWYYTNTLKKTSGNLRSLEVERIQFWSTVLDAILHGKLLPNETRQKYIEARDRLRSTEEKERQVGLH